MGSSDQLNLEDKMMEIKSKFVNNKNNITCSSLTNLKCSLINSMASNKCTKKMHIWDFWDSV